MLRVTYTDERPTDPVKLARSRYDSYPGGRDPLKGIGDAAKIARSENTGSVLLVATEHSSVITVTLSGTNPDQIDAAAGAVARDILETLN